MSGGLVDDYLAQLLGAAAEAAPPAAPQPEPLVRPPEPEPPRAAADPPAPAPRPMAMSPSSPDEISEDEFEAMLDNLHGGKPPGAVAVVVRAPKSPEEIIEDEFEALLDNLHGGKPPGTVALAPVAPPSAAPVARSGGDDAPPDGPDEDDPNWHGRERRASRRNSRWLRMRVHQQDYGVELLKVQEVLLPVGVLAMRDTDVSMLGVMNLRGVVVPVIDLGLWLGLEEVLEDAQTRFVVLEQNGECLALKVSSVLDVHAIGDSDIEPAENTLASPGSAMLRGVTRLNLQPVILLDAAGLLG